MARSMVARRRGSVGLCLAVSLFALAPACGSSGDSNVTGMGDGGTSADGALCGAGQTSCNGTCVDVTTSDDHCGDCATVCTGGQHCANSVCQASKIEHVVLIVEENHTFDSYFGRYCQAPAGSNPTCTDGPRCCEAAPDHEPRGASPQVLDDASNYAEDRDHAQACEVQQINGGKMDGFVTGSSGADTCFGVGPHCASANNWALADQDSGGDYWTLAAGNALADRYFQPVAGSSSSNNMYFATAHYQFLDNAVIPNSIGAGCSESPCENPSRVQYEGRTTIADLLLGAGKTFAVYADGFADAKAAAPSCASPSSDCRYSSCLLHPIACHACVYDPSDIPFAYYKQLGDQYIRDYDALKLQLASGSLPAFAFVKAKEWRNEHPNVSTISDGVSFVTSTIGMILSSAYADSTLILLTWDEGGGFFDHVAPPASVDTDDQGKPVPHGTRVPMLAIGHFARKGSISHVQMEHSSVVRFLEYNFLGPVGQLGNGDAKVNNIGSLLDPDATGVRIPEE